MAFCWFSVLIYTTAVNYCTGFDIFTADDMVNFKRLYGENKVEPILEMCADMFKGAGFNADDMMDYAGNFTKRRYSKNMLFDCAWGCFFLRMGWLDDLEGSYKTSSVLHNLEDYIPVEIITHAKIVASRCNYVNFPRPLPPGPLPLCGQARLLKDCLILEKPVPPMTEEYKAQAADFLEDWLWSCALEEHADVAALLAYVRRHTGTLQPEYGCALKCLFLDLGWMDVDPQGSRMFLMSVVTATVNLYYGTDDKTPEMIEGATRCVLEANELIEDGEFYPDTGCDRSMFLVECLGKIFV